ncbi:MAG: tRNA-dihydrouridine synthase [Verrucomicrobiota bacterium JB023]|nr:tRNA-dihydrouridine synthase [Verrucomicrobiota bacterium JB023]
MVDLPQPFLVLAPMQDVTDLAFMRTLMQCGGGPDLYVTEYFRVHGDSSLEKPILASVLENPTGKPVIAQMIGQDVDALVRTATELLGYEEVSGVDLNLGCPAPIVCSKNAGGGLLRRLGQVDEILGRLREACGERWFTVKTRLGFESPSEFQALLDIFAKHDLDMLSIHGRTVRERYQTPVHPDEIRSAVDLLECPVVANGNVVNVTTGLRYLEKTRAAGLMIGRGAIRNPWLFAQLREALGAGGPSEPVTRRQLLGYIRILWEETARTRQQWGRDYSALKHVQRMKRYLNYIVQGLEDELEFRMKRSRTQDELFSLLADFLDCEDPVPDLPSERSKLFCGFSALLSEKSTDEHALRSPAFKGMN